ncbi:hypothetical protein [Pedobacter sp. Leaf250]|uniref:hypothetical protein n=1 Tax=Pedobacter sp. Leaf250 TaxID=2876559 RepID=UPI001E5A41A0|nr:hypothetical protein [Pedobacter sp. Leaf250]
MTTQSERNERKKLNKAGNKVNKGCIVQVIVILILGLLVLFYVNRPKDAEIKKENSRIDSLKEIDANNVSATKKAFLPKVDPEVQKKLKPYFKIKKDEFDENGSIWFIPKTAPSFINANGIFCYFQVVNGKAENFRLKIQYYSEDWLFFNEIKFSVDGKAITYTPGKTETDSGDGGMIWEWSDEEIKSDDAHLIEMLASSKISKMKLIGRQYYKIKNITPNQIATINRTLKLFKAYGGTLR